MARPLLIEALGLIVALDLDGAPPAIAEDVRRAWRDAAVPTGDPSLIVPVTAMAAASDSREQLLSDLSQRVTLEAITARKGELWMLHAAGLALPDGRVIALVGPSGRGKTTAARALAAAGLGYVSDETVGVDRDGRVHAYRKPLSIIEGTGFKAQRAPSDVGLAALPDAGLRLAAVVLLERDPDHEGAPAVAGVDLGDALDELVTQTSFLASMETPLQRIAMTLAATGGMRRWSYRDAADLPGAVAELLSATVPMAWSPASLGAAPAGGGRYSRADVLDAVLLDQPERVAVVRVAPDAVDGVVWVLGGIAPALWEAADDAEEGDLVAAAVARFGVPTGDEPAALVRGAVEELVTTGALVRGAERVWRIAPQVAWHGDESRVVVLDLDVPDADVLALEGSAALIWMALADGGTVDQVAARVAETVVAAGGADEGSVRGDVASFLGALSLRGLVASPERQTTG